MKFPMNLDINSQIIIAVCGTTLLVLALVFVLLWALRRFVWNLHSKKGS